MVTADGWGAVHTAGLAVSWDEARRQGRLRAGSTVLLVSAGAGLTAGAALHHVPESSAA
jgi:3-oxoacyl-[acyl-carrier-protein] synthase III